jgi:hypothetical protein
MARTFTPITGSGGGGVYVSGDKHGYQTEEKIRQALDLLAYMVGHIDLGGDERGILSASYVKVNAPRTISLKGDNLGGLTLEAVVYYYTANAATSVRVRVRNLTDASDAVVGTLSTATTETEEVLTLTLVAGTKSYQLQVTGGDANNEVYAWGYLRLRKIPS